MQSPTSARSPAGERGSRRARLIGRFRAWVLSPAGDRFVVAGADLSAATLIVFVTTGVTVAIQLGLGVDRLSMMFLAGVLTAAALRGARAALFATILSLPTYQLFISEPRFVIAAPDADTALEALTFLVVALVVGEFAGRVRDQQALSVRREASLRALFEATRSMSATVDEQEIRRQLSAGLIAGAEARTVLTFDETGRVATAVGDPASRPPTAADLGGPDWDRAVAEHDQRRWNVRPLRVGPTALGAVAWTDEVKRRRRSEAASYADVIVELGSGAVARARLTEAQAETIAAGRTERLRTALLSSLSHDFRTPLSVILGSASSLLTLWNKYDAATRKDLLLSIQEEAQRLERFTANIMNMSKLESGALAVSTEAVDVAALLRSLASRAGKPERGGRAVDVDAPQSLMVEADRSLLELALENVVANAVAYTAEGTSVTLKADDRKEGVVVLVEDAGPGVPDADLPRLFDRFHRAETGSRRSGAGLGLYIARGLIESMGGSVVARKRRDGASGLCLVFTLRRAA